MAQITLNIPDGSIGKIVDSFTTLYNYSELIEEDGEMINNPQT